MGYINPATSQNQKTAPWHKLIKQLSHICHVENLLNPASLRLVISTNCRIDAYFPRFTPSYYQIIQTLDIIQIIGDI